ncbi:50S ribosomal protein L6 [Caenispirillum salinarum]|uniref:50S ribosomal protein L6 n=1 Tax=Caenispirillum salinarum TaxID=859058 RepID=UPI0005BB21C6|nr:50S ribosomal protein L6 [Caenispirillum salinarum]
MSRVGKYPVEVPSGVTVTLGEDTVTVKGKLGEMSMPLLSDLVEAKMEENQVVVSPKTEHKKSRMMWGTTRANIANMVKGVSEGFTKKLVITGVGYRAQAQGNTLKLSLGFSHDIDFPVPQDLKITTPQPTEIEISGSDKQRVGQIASEIRGFRPPEPYKGKGVRYADEQILRKEGKKK